MSTLVFPALSGLLGFPFRRSPIWSTISQQSVGGQTPRFALWSSPRWQYEINYEVLRSKNGFTEQQQLMGFYNQNYGSASVFQFADGDDGAVTAQNFGTGDGTSTTFQLTRTLGIIEPVYAPTGTPAISVAGVLKATLADYAIGATGIVTFTAAPAVAAALTWTGTYNWLAQFDDDTVDFDKDYDGIWGISGLKLTTVKL